MKKIIIALFLLISVLGQTQTKKPNKQECFDYLRGKLLSLSTKDGANGYLDAYNTEDVFTVSTEENNWYADIYFSNLDANTLAWDIFDPKPNSKTDHDKLLRVTISSKGSSYPARYPYYLNSREKVIDESAPTTITRFYFSISKAADIPDFQNKISKCLKRLILLCGGKAETKDPY